MQYRIRSLTFVVLISGVVFAWYFQYQNPVLDLEGFCPVTLVHKSQWQIGDPEFDAVYAGRLYLFAGQKEQRLFESQPERYAPVCSGADIVRLLDENREVQGKRQHGVDFQGRIYLFDSESTLKTFWASRTRYIQFAKSQSTDNPYKP